MPLIKIFICCLLLFLYQSDAPAQEQTPAQLVETVRSSLVEVHTIETKSFDEGNGHTRVGTYQSQGSGVILGSDGIIVTNTHIVAHAPHIYVGLSDGTVLEAKIVYSSDADFSFLKVEPPYSLNTITVADSSQAQIGTPIIALTNADDGQHILGGAITNMITNDASNSVELFELNLDLVHGDSGGPVLDSQGNLLGLIMAKRNSEDNKSYAIASNKIQQEYSQYLQNPQRP